MVFFEDFVRKRILISHINDRLCNIDIIAIADVSLSLSPSLPFSRAVSLYTCSCSRKEFFEENIESISFACLYKSYTISEFQ